MIGRAHHLQDDRLFDCYAAERDGSIIDLPAAEHLADCAECRTRYDELLRFMDGLRAEADVETDEIFTSERLRIQQQQIARRLEHLGHAARVLNFPGRLVSRHMTGPGPRLALRWAAAAAAAGLIVGVGVGTFVDRSPRPAAILSPPVRSAAPAVAVSAPPTPSDDDAFLFEVELALGGPRNRELLPFDALTPRVHEINALLR